MKLIASEAEKVGQQLQVLEQGLEGKDYAAGKAFTMGDIVVGVFVWRWYALPVQHPKMPRIESLPRAPEAASRLPEARRQAADLKAAEATPGRRHLLGHAAPVLTQASTSAPASACVPGAGVRPNPGSQAQPTSVSVPM